ncbi:MAG: Cys-Gln thioester bond-forming surface protein [Planctomycetes bacterium]|nr:Cys-Gln thioester bond-forming surface protein [Planctomycetota bacterium]
MNMRFIAAAALAFVGSMTVAANADLVDMRFVGQGHGRNVRVSTPSGTFSSFAGQLRHTFSNGTGLGAQLSGEKLTYCTDLLQHVSSNTQHYSVVSLASAPLGESMGADKAAAVASLYDYAMGVQLTSATSDDLACAFQLAVWEVVADFNWSLGPSSLSISSGNFRATQTNGNALSSNISNLLGQFFANTGNSSFTGSGLAAISSGTYQDQIVTVSVPAPGATALAGLGLGLIAKRRRR